jgi:ATP synthase subunit 6
MITSLFSSFDPITSYFSINYLITLFVIFFPSSLLFYISTTRRIQLVNNNLINFIEKELKASVRNKNKKGKFNILIRIFFIILLINLIGLIPYIFTFRAQIIFTLRFAFPLWLSFVIFSVLKNPNHFSRHLVPLRTPLPLSQFIVIIETVRQIIRPITLSVRLAANITAGHILMGLCTNNITIFNLFRLVLILLLILELAVAFIQRYVFTVLRTIYVRETYDTTKSSFSYSTS